MQIRNEFTLELPPQETYELLLDLERVTPCMPGASLGEQREDGSYAVNVKVKLGPMRFSYDGSVSIAEQDAAARRAVLKGSANETRGQGSAEAAITMQVEEAPDGSRVTATADIDLTGRAAQMGHGVVESVTRQLIGQMTRCLSQRFAEGPGEPEPAASAPAAAPVANGAGAATAAPRPAAPAPPPPPAPEQRPLKAGALVWAVLRERIASLFRRGSRGTT